MQMDTAQLICFQSSKRQVHGAPALLTDRFFRALCDILPKTSIVS